MDNLLTRLRAGDLEAERRVLGDPSTRGLVHLILAAASERDLLDSVQDCRTALAILEARSERLLCRGHMPPRLSCSV